MQNPTLSKSDSNFHHSKKSVIQSTVYRITYRRKHNQEKKKKKNENLESKINSSF